MNIISVELKLDLPVGLAHEAEANGLLTPESIQRLLQAEIRRRRREALFQAADRLAAIDAPPLTESEVETEIQAARSERRSRFASSR